MESPRRVSAQYRLRFTPEQSRAVHQYLYRTTLFWNFLLHHLKPYVAEYLEQPLSEESDFNLWNHADRIFKIVTAPIPDTHHPDIDERWWTILRQVRELPLNLLQNRLDDLLDSYSLAKRDRIEGVDQPSDLPRRKNRVSSQSVRFDPSDVLLTPKELMVRSSFPMVIEFPTPINVDCSKSYQISITMRRIRADVEKYGPVDDDDREYSLTLKEAA